MTIRATRPPVAPVALAAIEHGIPTALAAAVAADPAAVLVIDGETRLTRSDLTGWSGALQQRLRDAGVTEGDVVTVQLPNRAATIVAMHAIWGLGAIVNPVTPIYRGAELQAILGTSRPRAVLVPVEYREVDYPAMIVDALKAVGHEAALLAIDLDTGVPPSDDPHAAFAAAAAHPDDVAMLMFTSGTTGRPKGVLHSHRTLLYESRSIADVFALQGDNVFMPSPLSHITGLLYGVLMPLLIDGGVVLMDRWDPDAAVAMIERDGCSATVSATPFLRGLADSYARRGTPSSLRMFVCGGADIPAALVADARAAMGVDVSRTYGSTEMPTLCIVRPDDPDSVRLASEGRVIGDARARLTEVDAGVGELEVQGPELFVGYLDAADNTTAFTDDGWFRTGDLARIAPGGEITIVGRLKDLIVRGGENIGAKEIEDLLITHPEVQDVAIVGIPDDVMGERACAVVVAASAALRLSDLTAHLATTGIAKQKYPEALYLVDELPRTVSGKVQKFQLRALLIDALARGAVERRS